MGRNLLLSTLLCLGASAFGQCLPGQMTRLVVPTKAKIDKAGHTLPVQANVEVHVLGERDNQIFFYVMHDGTGRFISAIGATPYEKPVLACQKG